MIEGTLPSNECMHRRPEPSASPNHRGEYYCLDCGGYFLLSPVETKALPPLCDGAVQVIYERGEPSGVRDATGYLCFFNRVTKWPGQEERYRQELSLRARHAEVIANALRGVQETSTKSYRPCGCEGEACKGHPENGKGD